MEFLLMIQGEGQWLDPLKRSTAYLQKIKGRVVVCNKQNWTTNCKRESSYGHCQIHSYYHPKTTNDNRFSDSYWQLDQCWKLYKGGTKFYGLKNNRTNSLTKFK